MRDSSSPSSFVDWLLHNNRRWADENPPAIKSKQNQPQCLWLECSECPVSPAAMTGAASGELLVHRNLGNLATDEDASLAATLELALATFNIRDIVVCGHVGCVAMELAMNQEPQGSIDRWLIPVIEIANEYDDELSALTNQGSRSARLCELNVEQQVVNLSRACNKRRGAAQAFDYSIHGCMFQPSSNRIMDLDVKVFGSVDTSEKRKYGALH